MFVLKDEEKIYLLKVARKTLENLFAKANADKSNEVGYPKEINLQAGVFVTLLKDGALRGCIGRMESEEEITGLIEKMAIAAATNDHRFGAVKRKELNKLNIEISVLTPKVKINSIDEFDISKHGIYIQKGVLSGTFLPQVAKETSWDKEELLSRCSRDKAGLGWDGWRNADLFIYEVISFSEKDFNI